MVFQWQECSSATSSSAKSSRMERKPDCSPPEYSLQSRYSCTTPFSTQAKAFSGKGRYYSLSTSSIFQRQPKSSSVGIIARDDQQSVVHAQTLVFSDSHDAKCLALEAIRSAQLLAYNRGWQNISIAIDIEEIFRLVTHCSDPPVLLSVISEDINLLSHLFDDCCFALVTKQEHSCCCSLAKFTLDCPTSVQWASNFPHWIHLNPVLSRPFGLCKYLYFFINKWLWFQWKKKMERRCEGWWKYLDFGCQSPNMQDRGEWRSGRCTKKILISVCKDLNALKLNRIISY